MNLRTFAHIILLLLIATTTSAVGKTVNVRFAKGAISAQYSGSFKGYDYDSYIFYAKKGQKIRVMSNNETADTLLFGPGIADSVDLSKYSPDVDPHQQYTLSGSGKFELRVLQSRAEARKEKLQVYKINIEIK